MSDIVWFKKEVLPLLDIDSRERVKQMREKAGMSKEDFAKIFKERWEELSSFKNPKDRADWTLKMVAGYITQLMTRPTLKYLFYCIHKEGVNPTKKGYNMANLYGLARLAPGEEGRDPEEHKWHACRIMLSDKKGNDAFPMSRLDSVEEGKLYEVELIGRLNPDTGYIWANGTAKTTFNPVEGDVPDVEAVLKDNYEEITLIEMGDYVDNGVSKPVLISASIVGVYPNESASGWKMLRYSITDQTVFGKALMVSIPHTLTMYEPGSLMKFLLIPKNQDENFQRDQNRYLPYEADGLIVLPIHPIVSEPVEEQPFFDVEEDEDEEPLYDSEAEETEAEDEAVDEEPAPAEEKLDDDFF